MASLPTRSEIDALVAALASPQDFERERAVARLALAGQAAARRLAGLASDARQPPKARAAALQALGSIGGGEMLRAALAATGSPDDPVALEAIAVLGPVASGRDMGAAAALDRLTAITLDRTLDAARRRAAFVALEGLAEHLLAPIATALSRDPSSPTHGRLSLVGVADAGLPESAPQLAALLTAEHASAPVAVLCRLVDLVRQEEVRRTGAEVVAWINVRGQLHDALARRKSAIALYDIREAFERASSPLPMGFLVAASVVGDVTCLEPVAAAWSRAASADAWYASRLVDVFRAIARRERVTRQHVSITRIVARDPHAIALAAEVPARAAKGR